MAEKTEEPQTNDVIVRRARSADRDEVLAFCARTWPEGDYISYVWDEWLRDERGVFLVAAIGERPVGIVHVRMVSADEAWLEGIRVNPAARRSGIGRMLTSRALVAAHERGAVVARLFTDDDNEASQQLVTRFGFQRVAQVVRYTAPALARDENVVAATLPGDDVLAGARVTVPGADAFERLWAWLEQSNLAPLTGGLLFDEWSAAALNESRLRACLEQGDVLVMEEWDTILGLAIARAVSRDEAEAAHLDVGYIDGQADGIGRLATVLREVAGARGLSRVELWLPDMLILQDAMDGAGYAREATMFVYARAL